MKASSIPAIIVALVSLSQSACNQRGQGEEQSHEDHHKLLLTSPLEKDVIITQQYVCQIRSQNYIEVCSLVSGFLEDIPVKEGQAVKQGEVLFQILPTLYKAKLDAELAEVQYVQQELFNAMKLAETNVVSQKEVALCKAKLGKAEAKWKQAEAEMSFTTVRARFDGIIDRLFKQKGSKIKEEDILTTLSDNSVMWVYFNVPEARYLGFVQGQLKSNSQLELVDSRIELVLADGSTFNQPAGKFVTIEGKFNNETGNIAFRVDFPNPNGILRHGQTGNVLIHHKVHNAIVIPQRATFEILDKRYVYVVGEDNEVHQREIVILHEMDDIFVLAKKEIVKGEHKKGEHKKEVVKGIDLNDKIVFEGVRQVHDGQKLGESEFIKPEEVLADQKQHAE